MGQNQNFIPSPNRETLKKRAIWELTCFAFTGMQQTVMFFYGPQMHQPKLFHL